MHRRQYVAVERLHDTSWTLWGRSDWVEGLVP